MNILFISIAWPEKGERNLYTDLMDEFVRKGNNVYVAGTSDNGLIIPEEGTIENGINVLRVRTGKIRKTSHVKKALALFTLSGKMELAIRRNFGNMRFDLIIGPTPPVTLSTLFINLKRFYKVPFYLLLKDIWPQGSVDLKVMKKYSLPWIWLRRHEKQLYKAADFIGCMSPMGREYLITHNRFLKQSKIDVAPNTILPTPEVPEKPQNDFRAKYNIPVDSCVFLFSGNLGIGHGLHFLIDAIKELSEYNKAFFVVGGSGTQYRFLKKAFSEEKVKNAFLYEWLPREDFLKMLSTSDVGLILLYRYTVPQFPSRLLSYFDFQKPVLCAVNANTDIGKIVEQNNCGLNVNHGDLNEFVKAVKYLSENDFRRLEMGENSRRYLLDNYTVTHSYEIIMSHFKTV